MPERHFETHRFEEKDRVNKLTDILKRVRSIMLAGTVMAALDMTVTPRYSSAQDASPEIIAQRERRDQEFGNHLFNPSGRWQWLRTGRRPSEAVSEEPELEEGLKPKIGSIEMKDGQIRPEILEEILKTYPKGWIFGEIQSVMQNEEPRIGYEIDLDERGKRRTNRRVMASAEWRRSGKDEIVFTTNSKNVRLRWFTYILSHEIAHANDFERDNELDNESSRTMALELLERIKSKNRYKSYYVEHIKGRDRQFVNATKVIEYWAEICAQYFEDPTKLHINDVLLVETSIRKSDYNFDWQEAKKRRDELIAQAKNANKRKE